MYSIVYKFLIPVLLLLIVVGSSNAVRPLPPYAALPSQEGLARLFFGSSITRRDPHTSVACFASYISGSNQIGELYSNGYSECLDNAKADRLRVDTEFIPVRHRIEVSAEEVCGSLRACERSNNTLEALNCHATAGSNNTIATYTISGNSSEQAAVLQERYRLIDLHHEQCCHAAERRYVEATANNYNYLQACLDGRVSPKPIDTTTTSSTTTTTTTTTTEPPTTTTTTTPRTTTTTTEATTTPEPIDLDNQFKQLLNLFN